MAQETKQYLDYAGLEALVSKINTKLQGKADATSIPSVTGYVDKAEYNSEDKKIYFYNGQTKLGFNIDANDFVKDGMVDNVEVKDDNLVITFNTDSGKEAISIAITEIFNANNYYQKSEVDDLLEDKLSTSIAETTYQKIGNYALKSEIPTDYLTEENIADMATETWVKEQGYLKEGSLAEYAKSADVTAEIEEAIEDFVTEEDVQGMFTAITTDEIQRLFA